MSRLQETGSTEHRELRFRLNAMPETQRDPSTSQAERLRTARRIFIGALASTTLFTAAWIGLLLTRTGSGGLLGRRQIDAEALGRVLFTFLLVTVFWGWLWYGMKRLLLVRAGLTQEELRLVFSSRMSQPFDLPALLAGRSERMIRIFDMIGRRGRFVPLGIAGFLYVYTRVVQDPQPEFLTWGIQESLLDALFVSWLHLAAYHSDGFFGRVVFGAQTRIMDGVLGRANCLVITMLWGLFRFVMVPLSVQLAAVFPPHTFSALFAFIWLSYLACDACAEIFGALFGRQRLQVWGIGDVNRKSLAGTFAGFVASLALCSWLVSAHNLPASWMGLAIAVSVSNTLLELFSPRGTDDFTMATANAFLCWGFGLLVYGGHAHP